MDLRINETKPVEVGTIVIPEIFNRRFKSGIDKMDLLFGGSGNPGCLPGSSFTIAGKPGTGKSTLMLQWMEALTKVGYDALVASGEESIYQIAYNAKRINCEKVQVANISDIDKLAKLTEKYDVILIDSFQAMKVDKKRHPKMNTRALEKYAVEHIVQAAQKNECTLGYVMHVTKAGIAKGGMIIFHTVDANFHMDAPDDTAIRWVVSEKNRFGPPMNFSAALEPTGFDFTIDAVETLAAENKRMGGAPGAKSGKGARRNAELTELRKHYTLTLKEAAAIIGDMQRARFLMSDLKMDGSFHKEGRGDDALFTSLIPDVIAAHKESMKDQKRNNRKGSELALAAEAAPEDEQAE